MKIIGKTIIPAKEVEVITAICCDLCGAKAQSLTQAGLVNWGVKGNSFEFDRTVIAREVGYDYPEVESLHRHSFDICPSCWEDKVVPWFEQQGAQLSTEEVC